MASPAMKRPKKQRRERGAVPQFVEPRGAERFTVRRFFSGVGDAVMTDMAVHALGSGYQIPTKHMDWQLIPAFVILACYASNYEGVELVEDYEDLLQALQEATTEGCVTAHPDLFMASCIAMLHPRGQFPSTEAFESIGVPALYKQLVRVEE